MLPISEQYLLSPCEVRTMENAPILMGRVGRFLDDGIEFTVKDDRLPIVHCNTTVKISVMNNTLGFKVLVGRVYLSTEEFIRVVDLQNVMDYEKRNFFRVKVSIHTKAFPVTQTGSHDEPVPLCDPISVNIRDISLSGLFFVSECSHMDVGNQLIVNLNIYGTGITLLCKVVRKITTDRYSCGYGCEFLDSGGKQFDLLCKYLFDCQREQIQAMKQYIESTQFYESEASASQESKPLLHKKQTR